MKCIRYTFFLSHLLLLILTMAFIGCGIQAIQSDLFHGDMGQIYTDYVLAIVLFTLFYTACFCVMLALVSNKFEHWNNTLVVSYALAMFIFGFLLMAAQGYGLAALEMVDIHDI